MRIPRASRTAATTTICLLLTLPLLSSVSGGGNLGLPVITHIGVADGDGGGGPTPETATITGYSPGSVTHCHTSGCLPCGPYSDVYHATNAHHNSALKTWTNPTAHGACPSAGYAGSVAHNPAKYLASHASNLRVSIDGIGCRRVQDHGTGPSATRWLDVFFEDTGDAINWGSQERAVTYPSSC